MARDQTPEFDITATTNSLGLRGMAEMGPKAPGVVRILILGDSYTFGVGARDDETYCARLQQLLDAQGLRAEIVNAGTGSYSPILEYLTLRDLYLPLKPDGVVLLFNFGDLHDDYHYEKRLLFNASGEPHACNPAYLNGHWDLPGWLLKKSALMHWLHRKFLRTYERIRILGLKRYLAVKLSGGRTKIAVAEAARSQDALPHDPLFMIRDRSRLPDIERHWARTGGYILRIRDLLRQQGIPFVLAVFPHGVQVGPQQWAVGRVELGFEPGRVYGDPFAFEFMADFARRQDIALIDTHPAFLAAKDQKLFYDFDGHFTPAGNRVVAQAIAGHPAFQQLLGEGEISTRP